MTRAPAGGAMEGEAFRKLLESAGLQQVDVARLVEALTGEPGPDGNTVSRYCRDYYRVPATLAALVELYRRQPRRVREKLLPPR